MKVLLVNTFRDYQRYVPESLLPYCHFTATLEDLSDPWPPLEWAYVAAALRKAGHEVRFVDAHIEARDFGQSRQTQHRRPIGPEACRVQPAAGAQMFSTGRHGTGQVAVGHRQIAGRHQGGPIGHHLGPAASGPRGQGRFGLDQGGLQVAGSHILIPKMDPDLDRIVPRESSLKTGRDVGHR